MLNQLWQDDFGMMLTRETETVVCPEDSSVLRGNSFGMIMWEFMSNDRVHDFNLA